MIKKCQFTKLLSLFIASIILLSSAMLVYADTYKYKDHGFKAIVDEELKDYPFSPEYLEYLEIDDYNIWSLEGIQNFPRMYQLYIEKSSISDFTPISYLTELNSLEISDSCITDLTPIKDLKELKYLTIDNCNIEDFSVLSSLTGLISLKLTNCNVKDLSFLKNLTELRELDLSENFIEDLSALSYLPKLRTIDLFNNEIRDLSPLKNLKPNNDDLSAIFVKELEISENLIDKNSDVINSLRNKGYDVLITSPKDNNLYPIKINNKRYNYLNKVDDSYIMSMKFNSSIEKFKENSTIELYYNDNYKKLESNDYKIEGNMIFVNISNVFDDDESCILLLYNDEDFEIFSFYKDENETLGDINENEILDITDLATIAKDYNKNSKDSETWNYKEDVNRDGIIDIYDLSLISANLRN